MQGWLNSCYWQAYDKGGSFAFFALHDNRTIVGFNNLVGNSQANAMPGCFLAGFPAVKTFKYVG
jgi:hypothetical protein